MGGKLVKFISGCVVLALAISTGLVDATIVSNLDEPAPEEKLLALEGEQLIDAFVEYVKTANPEEISDALRLESDTSQTHSLSQVMANWVGTNAGDKELVAKFGDILKAIPEGTVLYDMGYRSARDIVQIQDVGARKNALKNILSLYEPNGIQFRHGLLMGLSDCEEAYEFKKALAINSTNLTEKSAALTSLKFYDRDEVIALGKSAGYSESESVTEAAGWILEENLLLRERRSELARPSTIQAIRELMEKGPVHMRRRLTLLIRENRRPWIDQVIKLGLADADANVRYSAINQAQYQFGDRWFLDALKKMAGSDPSPPVRAFAEQILKKKCADFL